MNEESFALNDDYVFFYDKKHIMYLSLNEGFQQQKIKTINL